MRIKRLDGRNSSLDVKQVERRLARGVSRLSVNKMPQRPFVLNTHSIRVNNESISAVVFNNPSLHAVACSSNSKFHSNLCNQPRNDSEKCSPRYRRVDPFGQPSCVAPNKAHVGKNSFGISPIRSNAACLCFVQSKVSLVWPGSRNSISQSIRKNKSCADVPA